MNVRKSIMIATLLILAISAIGGVTLQSSSTIVGEAITPIIVPTSGELFGHVILVEGYSLPNFRGCHALVTLRDYSVTVAFLTSDQGLQSLLETALTSGNLIAFIGVKLSDPPTPRGGTWSVDVYSIDCIILYNMK